MASGVASRWLPYVAVASAVCVFGVGVKLADSTGDMHWLNRAGAVVVCLETMLILSEWLRRSKLKELEETFVDNQYIRIEAKKAEGQVIWVGTVLGVAGEFVHGFGDLILEWAGWTI